MLHAFIRAFEHGDLDASMHAYIRALATGSGLGSRGNYGREKGLAWKRHVRRGI